MTPQTTIQGIVRSVEPYFNQTGELVATTITIVVPKLEGETVLPVKWFRERAAIFNDPALVGSEIIAVCNVSSREYQGRHYIELLGAEYGFKTHAAPSSAPVSESDLPF